MPTYIVERTFPGASQLTEDELRQIADKSCEVIKSLDKPYIWHQSFVAGDKIYCVHEAESEDSIREHARCGGFPADRITEVSAVITPESIAATA